MLRTETSERLTDETERALCESQSSRVEQQAEAVGSVFESQHVQHGQEEARLRNRAQAGACRVLVRDGLQRNRLNSCTQEPLDLFMLKLQIQN